MTLKRLTLLAALLGGAAFAQDAAPPADPAPLLDEARTALAAGEIGHARRAAEKAAAALGARQGEAIRAVLPPPLDGWTMQDGETTNIGIAAMGGGVVLDRTYSAADGTDVRIEIMADSDMVEQMAAMFMDPAIVAAMGVKTEIIAGETGLIDPSDGRITFIVDKRSSIVVSGSAPAEMKKAYAEKIGFAAFRAIK